MPDRLSLTLIPSAVADSTLSRLWTAPYPTQTRLGQQGLARARGGIKAVVLNDTRVDRHHGCDAVMGTILQLCRERGIEVIATAPAHRDWRRSAEILEAMTRADLVLVNGEGTIHHDRLAGRWLLEAGSWAREHGKASALINMTWQANSEEASHLLRSFDIVTVRESMSEAELNSLGVRCMRIPDLAVAPVWQERARGAAIGFTDSVLGARSAQLARLRRQMGGETVSIFHGPRRWGDLPRAVKRHLVGSGGGLLKSLALGFETALSERRAQIDDLSGFAAQIGELGLLVTGRFHALVIALATRTPFIAVASNSHKMEATVRDAGLEDFRVSAPERIDRSALEQASKWTDQERARLEFYLKESREGISALFDRLKAIAR